MGKIKVKMHPHPSELRDTASGVARVVEMYGHHLPAFGIELVKPSAASYDLIADHAGAARGNAHVAHNHGLYWTADMPTTGDNHYRTNRHVIDALRSAIVVTVPSRWVAHNIARDMHFLPRVVPHGITWDEWQGGKPQGYVLWNKNRTADVCDVRPWQELAKRVQNVPFIATFGERLPNTTITGRIPYEKMREYVKGASVYVATTKETFGIGTLEAMAAGVPVVGFDWGGTADLVVHGETGYLVAPNDYDGLVDGLHYCMKHRGRLSAAARERAKAYTWEATAQLVAQAYQDTLAMMRQPATVSIVIPCYNYGDRVGRAIESALSQTVKPSSIIVVDDGSDDNGLTRRTVEKYRERGVRYVRQDNAGVGHARNHGASLTDSKYLCFLDADDMIAPTFIETLLPEMERDRSLGIAYTSLLIVNRKLEKSRYTDWPPQCHFDQQLKGRNQVPTCCLVRRTAFDRTGGYRQRYAPQGCGTEDAELWLRIGADGWGIKKVSSERLFHYTWGGYTGNKTEYEKMNWIAWHPWTRDGLHPFASIATPKGNQPTHAVRQYDEPGVSVVIPVGPKHTQFVVDALDSLEAQTFRKWEAIVVNDSGEPLDLSPWPYVTAVETPGAMGAGYARNRGTEVAKAPYVVYLDADDFLQSLYLERALLAAKAYPGSWVYTDMYIHKTSGELEVYRCEDWDVNTLWRRGVASVTSIYPIEAWRHVGGFDETLYREEWDFHLRLAKSGICGIHLAEPLFTYRHATGDRRIHGSHRKEIVILHQMYDREELKTMCRSCGGQRKVVGLPATTRRVIPSNWTTKADAGWPMVEFVGKNKNDIVFRGPTRRAYTAGNNQYHRVIQVHPNDLAYFLNNKYFKEFVDVEMGMTAETPKAPVEAKPVQPKKEAKPKAEPKSNEPDDKSNGRSKGEPIKPQPSPSPDEPYVMPSDIPINLKPYLVRDIKEMDFSGFTAEQLDVVIYDEQQRKNRLAVVKILQEWRDRAAGATQEA